MGIKTSRGATVILILVAAAAFAVFITLWATLLREKSSELALEMAKAAFALGVGASAGVVVKRILEQAKEARRAQAQQRQLKQLIVTNLKAVGDGLETARLLMLAHQSAKTYGEQIRRITSAYVRLLGIRRTIESGEVELGSAGRALQESMAKMLAYMNNLCEEYREKYLRVSRLQRLDEKLNKDAEGKHAVGQDPERVGWSSCAWDLIHDPEEFPALADLLAPGPQHGRYFRGPLESVCSELRHQIAASHRESEIMAQPDAAESVDQQMREFQRHIKAALKASLTPARCHTSPSGRSASAGSGPDTAPRASGSS